jgi:energy-coupling factor transporter ATP-binding protein EcfA2
MKLVGVHAQNIKPLRLVQIADLSDIVVIAGPNGVGKTRLVTSLLQHIQNLNVNPDFYVTIKVTTEEEKSAWEKDAIVTNNAHDASLLRQTIQRNRKRSNFTSSFLNFESNRSIQQIHPFNWDWNFVDPYLEEVNWTFGMNNMTARFQDLLHSIFRKLRSRREAIALHFEELVKQREAASAATKKPEKADSIQIDPEKFPDPLQPFKDAFAQLLAPKVLLDPEIKSQQLDYKTEEGEKLPITSLSSGEREVVNIVFDFLLRSPSDCVIVFDEPELHLHPELSYRLLQTLQRIGARNQFIFCTHSADIITASLENTVVFIAPPKDASFNQALIVKEDDETHQALKLLGQSIGVISLGRKIVLIEGEQGSLDKQTYGAILKNRFPRLVLVPSGGRALLQSFGALHDKVLAKTIWGVEFFMLCDRDALPLTDANKIEVATARRLRLLGRYHLENYFLDEKTIAKVFEPLTTTGSWQRAPDQIRAKLNAIATEQASYAAALMTAAYFREECGNLDIMPKACNGKTVTELTKMITDRSDEEAQRLTRILDKTQIEKHVTEIMRKIEASLAADTDEWKMLIPGRIILKKFCKEAGLDYDLFRTAYINAAESMSSNPFQELVNIFQDFDQYSSPGSAAVEVRAA